MERRPFLQVGAIPGGPLLVPVFGTAIAAEELLNPMAVQFTRSLAAAARNAATKAGASGSDGRGGGLLIRPTAAESALVPDLVKGFFPVNIS